MRAPRVFQAIVLLAVVSHMTSAKEPPPRKVEKPVSKTTATLDKSGNLLVNYLDVPGNIHVVSGVVQKNPNDVKDPTARAINTFVRLRQKRTNSERPASRAKD